MNAPDAIRYPVGFSPSARQSCLYSLLPSATPDSIGPSLSYVEARKQIYVPFYVASLQQEPQYKELLRRFNGGESMLICEVDGPHQESLDYYRDKYGVPSDWIQGHAIRCTEDNWNILVEDTKHPFGHGYALAGALAGFYSPTTKQAVSCG